MIMTFYKFYYILYYTTIFCNSPLKNKKILIMYNLLLKFVKFIVNLLKFVKEMLLITASFYTSIISILYL